MRANSSSGLAVFNISATASRDFLSLVAMLALASKTIATETGASSEAKCVMGCSTSLSNTELPSAQSEHLTIPCVQHVHRNQDEVGVDVETRGDRIRAVSPGRSESEPRFDRHRRVLAVGCRAATGRTARERQQRADCGCG